MTTFRWIDTAELPTVQSLAEDIWWSHYHPTLLSAEQIRFMLQWMYSLDNLTAQANEGYRFLLAEQAGRAIGYASVHPGRDGVAELSKFYLHPAYQGQGLGRRMMQACEAAAHLPVLQLWVYRLNIQAINFYFRQGFHITASTDRPIGQGHVMHDFIMQKNLAITAANG